MIISDGMDYAESLLQMVVAEAKLKGLDLSKITDLSFKNTVSEFEEEQYPGDLETEERIRHYIRWNSLFNGFES